MSVDYTIKSTDKQVVTHIDYESELNESQFQAVSAKPGPLLVIAGAGSGKTRTLTYRVAFLVEHGVNPHQILLLTFTNKASKEMLRRVADLLPIDISSIWGGTFHHIGHRFLRRHPEKVGLSPRFTIMDREDSKSMIGSCLAEAGINPKEKRFPKAEVLQDAFSLHSNTGQDLPEIIKTKYYYFSEFTEEITGLYRAYIAKKRTVDSVDYDDLLTLTLRLLRDNPDILTRYQDQFQHILVDEYQDTNKLQSDIIDLLADRHKQVMVVGDDAQSIYSWRGANFANIMKFPERYKNAKIIKIETNYRSTPEILALANESISNNIHQFDKTLASCRKNGPKPAVVQLRNGSEQAMFVAQRILELYEDGTELREIAVLYRSHFHSMDIQMELTRRNIPYQITSGIRFFEQAHIKDITAYLKLALNGKDEIAFKRIASTLPGIGPRTTSKLWQTLNKGTEWDKIPVPAKARSTWIQWGETHRQLIEQCASSSPDRLIQWVLDAGYDEYIKLKYPNYQTRLEDIGQLMAFASQFPNLEEFLAQLSLLTNLEVEPIAKTEGTDQDTVRLSTIHQAKGLEWKAVFVVMLCEGMFPSNRSLELPEGEEEERRLFYVATTRAKDELYLTHPAILSHGPYNERSQLPSRFLHEPPPDLYTIWNIKS